MKGEERAYMKILCHFTDILLTGPEFGPQQKEEEKQGRGKGVGRREKGRRGRRRGIANAATQDCVPAPLSVYRALSSQLVKLE